jgi:hypothetical protein
MSIFYAGQSPRTKKPDLTRDPVLDDFVASLQGKAGGKAQAF